MGQYIDADVLPPMMIASKHHAELQLHMRKRNATAKHDAMAVELRDAKIFHCKWPPNLPDINMIENDFKIHHILQPP